MGDPLREPSETQTFFRVTVRAKDSNLKVIQIMTQLEKMTLFSKMKNNKIVLVIILMELKMFHHKIKTIKISMMSKMRIHMMIRIILGIDLELGILITNKF